MHKHEKQTSSGLFKKLNLILGLHIAMLVAFVLDLLPCPYIAPGIAKFFSYAVEELVSALLVVWAFLTTIIVYYMGRKDECFCGFNNWEIIFKGLSKCQQYIIISIYWGELVLMLLSYLIALPITMVMCTVLLPITTAYSLWIVIKSTEEQVLKEQLKAYIGNNERQDETVLCSVVERWDFSKESNLDVLKEIMMNYFDDLFKDIEKITLEHMRPVQKILSSQEKLDMKKIFFKDLFYKLSIHENQTHKEDVLTGILCLILEKEENSFWINWKELVSVVGDARIRTRLILRGIIYNQHLDTCKGKRERILLQEDMRCVLSTNISAEDKKDALLFAQSLYENSCEESDWWKDVMDILHNLEVTE